MNIQAIKREILKNIDPSKEELKLISSTTKKILKDIRENIKKQKIKAEIFIGGSFAKDTLIKKDKYDIDIYVRFDGKYKDGEISELLSKIIPNKAIKIHGSRDYFSLKGEKAEFEIIPVINIKKPEEAKNITDLSYFHVNYIKSKERKNKKLENEIKIAKSFIYASDCYGAESYINGFSGYAVELLIVNYKSFENFIRAMAKTNIKKEKIIIDNEKKFKSKEDVMKDVNEAKLFSPIILIDPTFKERNALAALSEQTFLKFREICLKFLRKPSIEFFKSKDKETIFIKKYLNKGLKEIRLKTKRQAGDIAGTKLKKFYNFFINEAKRYFEIEAHEFVYDEKVNEGKILFSLREKKQIVFNGPPINMKIPLSNFKREHKNIKIIGGKAYAYEKTISFQKFMNFFENEKEELIEGMGVSELDYS